MGYHSVYIHVLRRIDNVHVLVFNTNKMLIGQKKWVFITKKLHLTGLGLFINKSNMLVMFTSLLLRTGITGNPFSAGTISVC